MIDKMRNTARRYVRSPAVLLATASAVIWQPRLVPWLIGLLASAGCTSTHPPPWWHAPVAFDAFLHADVPPQAPVLWDNPMFVPATDIDFLWDQVVDAIDNYFKIAREDRLRLTSNVLTEGRLETFPTVGATCLEPWKKDATPGLERWQSTLQTIRRTCMARVTPAKGGYLIEVVVVKELEDLYQPQHSTVGGAALRHDGALVRTDVRAPRGPTVLGWIPLGRDTSLEQRILADLRARLTTHTPPHLAPPGHSLLPHSSGMR